VVEATTRHRVMRHIVEHNRVTAADLAAAFHLTPAAIRRHLTVLVDQGMVRQCPADAGAARQPGRPAHRYAATLRGRETFAHAYDELAIDAVATLRRISGDDAVWAFFEQRFSDVEARFGQLRATAPELSQSAALAQVLDEDGFMSSLGPAGAGEQLCQHHCPYPAVAARFPELCSAETAVFARLLQSHIQRLATIAHGDGVCTTNIPLAGPRKES